MFLTPLPFKNNLAYTGTSGLKDATLGVYLEWWDECDRAIIKKDGVVQSLTYCSYTNAKQIYHAYTLEETTTRIGKGE